MYVFVISLEPTQRDVLLYKDTATSARANSSIKQALIRRGGSSIYYECHQIHKCHQIPKADNVANLSALVFEELGFPRSPSRRSARSSSSCLPRQRGAISCSS